MNRRLRRPYTKRYDPSAMAHVMDKTSIHNRGLITPGSVVTVTAHFGPFRLIHDEHSTEWSVGKGSLVPVGRKP